MSAPTRLPPRPRLKALYDLLQQYLMNGYTTTIVLASASATLASHALLMRDVSTAKSNFLSPSSRMSKLGVVPHVRGIRMSLLARASFTDEASSSPPSLSGGSWGARSAFCASVPLLSGQLTDWEVHWDRGSGEREPSSAPRTVTSSDRWVGGLAETAEGVSVAAALCCL